MSESDQPSLVAVAPELVDARRLLADAEMTIAQLRRWEANKLRVAADWADLHPAAADPKAAAVRFGGEGTPSVLAYCAIELGVVLRTTTGSAHALIADALDLRHRLPQLWRAVLAGRVEIGKAVRVARMSREFDQVRAGWLDAQLVGAAATLPWGRFLARLEGKLIEADPEAAALKEAERARQRFVRLGRVSDAGLRMLIVQGDPLDLALFMAAVERIAAILTLEGDTDPVDVVRAKAVGVLGRPHEAAALLDAHASDQPDPELPDEPGDDPDQADAARPVISGRGALPAPRVQLYVSVSEDALCGGRGVARIHGLGPVSLFTLRSWFQRPGARRPAMTVRPVFDPYAAQPIDCYEIPSRFRESQVIRMPYEAFPWGATPTRAADGGPGADLDHTIAYRQGGPPGQTGLHNLGPLNRRHHNGKTHHGFGMRQPVAGVFLTRTPHGYVALTTNQGTFPFGAGELADAFWDAATIHDVERDTAA